MKWQLFIYVRLDLETKSSQVVTDFTGILSSKPFLAYLDTNGVNYIVTDNVQEMLAISGVTPVLVIITNIKSVPAFITNKFTYKQFTFADIPLNGEIVNILKPININSIINLLEYIFSTDQHKLITKYNINSLLEESHDFVKRKELKELLQQVKTALQSEITIQNILHIAKIWGKLVYLSTKYSNKEYEMLIEQVDGFASDFIHSDKMKEVSYASTARNPKAVDKILINIKEEDPERIALLCFDCMGYSEWFLIKDFLAIADLSFTDTPLFTMLPSVTTISRTAIFHGSRNVYNIKSPGRTDEAKAFASFFSEKTTKYFTEQDLISDDALLGYDCISVLYSFFDDLCHSAKFPPNETSKELYFNSVRDYLKKSNLLQTLQILRNNGFTLYFCSDHGSVVAFGNGQRLDKYLIDKFAKRAVIIPTESSDLIPNEKIKIPFVDDKLIVLPEGRSMFANLNQIEINHGGITVEEMIVPYIKIKNDRIR